MTLSPASPTLAERLDAWLPQTQCRQCGYPRCQDYAEALAEGKADINQCPPGGEVTIRALGELLGAKSKPLDPRYGEHRPRTRAVIDETLCIGCRKCIDACPVDAIVGARKWMHAVIADECTGCELCLPPCPVDCIAMVPVQIKYAQNASSSGYTNSPHPQNGKGNEGGEWPEYSRAETNHWRRQTENRLQRLARGKRARRSGKPDIPPRIPGRDRIRDDIRASVTRVKARKRNAPGSGSSTA